MLRDDVPTLPSWESLQQVKAQHERLERIVREFQIPQTDVIDIPHYEDIKPWGGKDDAHGSA